MTMSPRRTALALVLAAALFAGCSDDDQEAAVEETDETRLQTTGASSDDVAYCVMSQEMGAQQGRATEEELAQLENIAPPEIRDAVSTAVEAELAGNADSDEAAGARAEIVAWEAENCDAAEAEAPDDNEQPGQIGGVEPPETETED